MEPERASWVFAADVGVLLVKNEPRRPLLFVQSQPPCQTAFTEPLSPFGLMDLELLELSLGCSCC